MTQPEAREGQAGRPGVAERFVVLRKRGYTPVEGRRPQFKTDAINVVKDLEIWETYQLR